MKFLLFTAALALVSAPVQAMDYVKCEAMQKASGRLKVSMDWRDPYNAEMSAKQMAECGAWWDYKTMAEYNVCADPIFDAYHNDLPAKQAWIAEYEAPFKARLAKIQADYEAEGCY